MRFKLGIFTSLIFYNNFFTFTSGTLPENDDNYRIFHNGLQVDDANCNESDGTTSGTSFRMESNSVTTYFGEMEKILNFRKLPCHFTFFWLAEFLSGIDFDKTYQFQFRSKQFYNLYVV